MSLASGLHSSNSTAIHAVDRCEAPGDTGGYETGKPLKSFWLRHTQRGL